MKIKERITKPRIVAYIVSCVLPLLVIGLGIFLLLHNTLFGTCFMIVMVILPLTAMALMFSVIFSKMRVPVKTVFVILLMVLFMVVFFFGFMFGKFEKLIRYENEEAIQRFETKEHWAVMPVLDEVGQPQKIEYIEYCGAQLIFAWDVQALVCQYTETEYETQKVLLEEKYVFQTTPMTDLEHNCEPTAQIDGYTFRTLAVNDVYGNAIYYPKCMAFIAVNNEQHKIIYLSFYDADLDFIVSLTDFVNDYCGWKYIR